MSFHISSRLTKRLNAFYARRIRAGGNKYLGRCYKKDQLCLYAERSAYLGT